MQNICFFFRRLIAKTIPQDMAAGKAGGTVTVIKSRPLSMIISEGTPRLIYRGMVAMMPITATIAMIPTNLNPSE